MRNVRFRARHYHLCYAFSIKRWIPDRSSNHSRENQHNISSGPPNWQKQNARGTFALGDPVEGLEK
ncbi:hypothetical protein E2C01_083893 [Portunus trituberculatus]|uniref:Uncharacterized protein n=1 Tax=Portunus trituberculatus TaxID=210409 RepID=A0A5B7J4U4_PORTR|nr:hypothetical protein [Portunus trituberculatus]